MEINNKIPTNFSKQDQGHRLLSVEISHRSRSSSLKYMLSLYNSKNIYKQTSVCSPKPNCALLPQLGISENSSLGKKSSKLWSIFVNKISYKGAFWSSAGESLTLKNASGDWQDKFQEWAYFNCGHTRLASVPWVDVCQLWGGKIALECYCSAQTAKSWAISTGFIINCFEPWFSSYWKLKLLFALVTFSVLSWAKWVQYKAQIWPGKANMGGGGEANKISHCIKCKNNKVEGFFWVLGPINLACFCGRHREFPRVTTALIPL